MRKAFKHELETRQRRRMRAARLLDKGVAQAEVARRLEVSRTTVSRWARTLSAQGRAGLKRPSAFGRPAGLSRAQRRELALALKGGALAQGYATELWTLSRVGRLIEQRFTRRYSDSQVLRIMRALGWSCQRPAKRAVERDETAIRAWKRKRWPLLKKTLPAKAASSSS